MVLPSMVSNRESAMPPPPLPSRQPSLDTWNTGYSYSRLNHSQRDGAEAAPLYRFSHGLAQDWSVPNHRGSQHSGGSMNSRNLSYASNQGQGVAPRAPMAEMTSDYRQNANIPLEYPDVHVDLTLPPIYHGSPSKRLRED